MESVAEFFEKFESKAAANTDAATSPNAIYQFNITGDGGGEYHLDLVGIGDDEGEIVVEEISGSVTEGDELTLIAPVAGG